MDISHALHGIGIFKEVRQLPEDDFVKVRGSVGGHRRIELRPAPNVLGLAILVVGQVSTVGITGIHHIGAKHKPHIGIGCHHQQVAVERCIDVMQRNGIHLLHHLARCLPVAQHGGRRITQTAVGIFHGFVPLLIIEIETAGKRIRGTLVEMILWHGIDSIEMRIAHHRQGFLQVTLNLSIHTSHSAALIIHADSCFRLRHVGNTKVGLAGLLIIMLAKQVDQHEVSIRTAEQSLRLGFLQILGRGSAHLFNGEQRLVSCGNRRVAIFPESLRGFVIALCHVAPAIDLVSKAVGVGIVLAIIIHVVRHELCHQQ